MKYLSFLLALSLVSNAHAATIDLDALVVEATRSNDIYADVTRPVSIITSEEIAASPAKSLSELIGSKVGAYGIKYGNIKNAQVDIRGFGETAITNVLVLVNGRRTNQIDLSGQDWAQVDTSSIDHVEIIRGASTVLYGDNATGGVINIVTKKGAKDSRSHVALSSEYGSYQSSKHGLELSGGTKTLDYQFNYGHEETTGYRANSDYWANDWKTTLGYDPTDVFGIDFSQGYHYDRYQLPGALFASNIASFGRRGVRASLNNDHGWTSDAHFDLTPHLDFTAGTSEGQFSIYSSARKRNNKFHTGSSVYETMYLTNTYEFQPKVIVITPLTDTLNNKATAGVDVFYAKSMRRSGSLGTAQDLVYVTKNTQGVYALDELTLDDKWLLNLGARGSWAEYTFDQKSVVTGKSVTKPNTKGYEGGIGYKYNPQSKVYVDFARSYRLPATDEFFQNLFDFGFGVGGGLNSSLTYQEGNHYEVGVKDNSIKDLNLGLNVFTSRLKREIYLDPATFNNVNYDGKTRHYGIEAEAAYQMLNGALEPFVNLTLQEAQFKGGSYAGKDIPFVPESILHAGLTWHPIDGLSTGPSMDYVGERFAISDVNNTQPKLKRYATFDWNTSYALKNFEVWLAVRNMLDNKYNAYGVYSSFAGDTGYYPAPERNVTAGVKVKF
jgi:iron complex outermembrane recepter protein